MTPAQSIGLRLQRAREGAGLTLREVAAALGVSHTAIDKYEAGTLTPNSQQLLGLAKRCGVRVEYFLRPSVLSTLRVEYRKKSRQSAKTKHRIEGVVLDLAERRLELERLFPRPPTCAFAVPAGLPPHISTAADVERAANAVRSAWDLGKDPVGNLVDVLELRGIRIFPTSVYQTAFDGLLMQLRADPGEHWPIILLDDNWPGDRQRFTLAHELGHLLLHDRLRGLKEEKACDMFAGAFLLPADVLRQRLTDHRKALEPRELYLIKHAYGVSMTAVVMRACQVGIISQALRTDWIIRSRKNGWGKKEPGDPIPSEQPLMFEHLVYRALAEDVIGEAKAAEILGLSLHEFHARRTLGESQPSARQERGLHARPH